MEPSLFYVVLDPWSISEQRLTQREEDEKPSDFDEADSLPEPSVTLYSIVLSFARRPFATCCVVSDGQSENRPEYFVAIVYL